MVGMGVWLMGLAVVDSAARCEMPPPSSSCRSGTSAGMVLCSRVASALAGSSASRHDRDAAILKSHQNS